MKLAAKFNLIFAASFGIGMVVAAWVSHGMVQTYAQRQVIQQAHLMLETALSMRSYTSEQIVPLLRDQHMSFLPQTVPAYAATEGFNYLRQKYPDYTYKEATLNPTNPRDRASDWEADIINNFRNNPSLAESTGTRLTALGPALYLARPITITEQSCLQCHSTADTAPPEMIKAYGTSNGFGWKLNETVGAQIIQVPQSLPVRIADHEFYVVLASLIGVFLFTLIVLNVTLLVTVIRPVSELATRADEVSAGKIDAPEVRVKGKDEIAALSNSFNRMKRSLAKALKMLDS